MKRLTENDDELAKGDHREQRIEAEDLNAWPRSR